jgi:hypothetical protein
MPMELGSENDDSRRVRADLRRMAEEVAASMRISGFNPTPEMMEQVIERVARSIADGSYERRVEEARIRVGHPEAGSVVTDAKVPRQGASGDDNRSLGQG